MTERSREILRLIIDAYVETGAPVGSRTLSRRLGMELSAATIRNVMADLEELGLLMAPHTSAGRLPTEQGLRLYVHGLLESQCAGAGRSVSELLNEAGTLLSSLSRCAGLVVAPALDESLKHIEFVSLGPGRALVVLVTQSGQVENRIIDVPVGLPPSSLVEASNFLSANVLGRTLSEAQRQIVQDLEDQRAQLDEAVSRLVQTGLATWSSGIGGGALIVRGQSHLLNDINAIEDLERVRHLFAALERKESLLRLLDLTDHAEGVQIFIGAENELFGLSGCTLVISPYANAQQQIVGAIGVIGPTRLDYARIIPIVDYTAKVVGRLLG